MSCKKQALEEWYLRVKWKKIEIGKVYKTRKQEEEDEKEDKKYENHEEEVGKGLDGETGGGGDGGGGMTVVFDGYSDSTKNIKAAEQRRRTTKTSSGSEIIFDEFMTIPENQQQFFTNINNKSRFISMLSNKLPAANIAVKQAKNDADVLIIETAIEKFDATNTTIVIGEDVDLLVLLTARTPMDKIIYFLKPGRAQQRTEIYSSKSLSAYPKCQNYILFLHAITGCDTSSAMYRRGKTSVFKLFEKNDLTNCAKVFTKIDSTPQTIITEGIRFLLAVYGAPKKITCINKYRYLTFVKNTRNKKQI
ncbi:hypothetical protein M0804_009739 [Polistes exclamans]|nr:hypothetical protein M0804_009739 [Polistes exclamans]